MGSLTHRMTWGVTCIHAFLRARPRVRTLLPYFASVLQSLSLPFVYSQSENVVFDHISVEQGLSNVTVTAILQDHEGFMWFGTLDGLCRYDGYEMVVFRNNTLDTNSISDNAIWALCEDNAHTLWVGTYNGGLNRLDPRTQLFIRYKNAVNNPRSLSHNTVRAACEDRSGVLWIGTFGGGMGWIDPKSGEFHRGMDTASNILTQGRMRSIAEDPSGRLWIGTRDSGLYILGSPREILHHYVTDAKNPNSLPSNSVGSVLFENSKSVWIGTGKGLVQLNEESGIFKRYRNTPADASSLSDDNITGLERNDERSIWVGTFNGGLNLLDKATGRCLHFRSDPSVPGSLSDESIRTLYRDNTGNLWIGTSNGGVNKINTERKKFGLLKHNPTDLSRLSKGEVWAIYEDRRGTIWIGTDTGGLNKVDLATGKVIHYQHDPRNPNSPGSDGVSALLEDSFGGFWVGLRPGGLDRFDRKTGRWKHFRNNPADPTSLSRDAVYTLFEDSRRTLWVGTWDGGLNKFNRKESNFTRFVPDLENSKSLSHNRVTAILEDPDSIVWIATEGGGVNSCNPATGGFNHFTNDPSNPKSISNDRAYCLYEDGTGTLWIGTAKGLNMFDRRTGESKPYLIADGLASDYVRAIVADDRGNLWLGTTKGVTRFDPRTTSFKNYDIRNGLQGEEFSGACWRTSDGTILLGGPDGVSFFHPESIVDNPHVPPIVITRFQIFEESVPAASTMLADGFIHLSYREDFFSFSFAALDFANPEKNNYAYMMKGFDRNWIVAGKRRYASYTNLNPGSYIFKVRGSNNDGVWNTAGSSLRVVIDPPFWQTWWFRTLVVAALASILLAIHNYRISKLLEVERMRVRIASDLHDDIGSSLSSIALITDMVRSSLTSHVPQQEQLMNVTRAARSTADSLRDIVWIISPEHDRLDDIILRMKDSAAKLLLGTKYTFHCTNDSLGSSLSMEFRRNLLLLYKEALNNIAKYAKATKVDISIRDESGLLHLDVTDNGIGFDITQVQKGNGLNSMKMRAGKIGGSIEIASTPSKGTSIRLRARIP